VRSTLLALSETVETCLGDPTICDPTTYARGEYLDVQRDFIKRMLDLRAYGRPRQDDPSYIVVKTVTIAPDGTTATATSCSWSTGILYGPGGGIYNDENVTRETIDHLVLDGDRWFLERSEILSKTVGTNLCAPRS
jgi:hypothetical protein